MTVLLVGSGGAVLEGISQTLAATGQSHRLASTVDEARELAALEAPLVVLVSRDLALTASGALLGVPLAPGGALFLFHPVGEPQAPLPSILQRIVLADLALPLERHRMVALLHNVRERARARGRLPEAPSNNEQRL